MVNTKLGAATVLKPVLNRNLRVRPERKGVAVVLRTTAFPAQKSGFRPPGPLGRPRRPRGPASRRTGLGGNLFFRGPRVVGSGTTHAPGLRRAAPLSRQLPPVTSALANERGVQLPGLGKLAPGEASLRHRQGDQGLSSQSARPYGHDRLARVEAEPQLRLTGLHWLKEARRYRRTSFVLFEDP